MSVDGFWVVQFSSPQVVGSGVVLLTNGKLYGGETGFYYIGTYEDDGRTVKARAMIRNFDPAVPTGFGITGDYEMDLSVILQADGTMTGTAIVSNHPQYNLGIRMTKRANL